MRKALLALALCLTSFLHADHIDKGMYFSGSIDAFGSMNTTNTDLLSNGVHLGLAKFDVTLKDESLNGKYVDSNLAFLELGYGENAVAFTSANGGSASPYVQQAYITQKFGRVSVQMGKFIGFLGYELPDSNSNLNYSRSPIFYAEPVYNVGLVGKCAMTDTMNFIVYGANENSSDVALDGTKDVGASLQNLGEAGGFAFNWYRDNMKAPEFTHRDLLNAYGYVILNSELTLAVEYLHGDLMLNSGAAYLSLFADPFTVSLRGVVMNNPGVIPGDTSTQYTLTLKQKRGSITNALEVITDVSNVSVYSNTATGTIQNNQTTLVLSSVYNF